MMNEFEKDGLAVTTLFLILLATSFYYAWIGGDLNVWLWLSGVGLVGSTASIIYFFVPDSSNVKGEQ